MSRAWVLCLVLSVPSSAFAQDASSELALDPTTYASLTADADAQFSLGGFRGYLERIRESDASLYGLLDRRLDSLEESETIADVVFWIGTALGVGGLVTAIPVHEEVGVEPALALIVAGAGTFLLGVIIQAFVRPSHSDLVALIDMHDERVGRR